MERGKVHFRLFGKGRVPILIFPRGRLIVVHIVMANMGGRVLIVMPSSIRPLTMFGFPLILH